MQKGSLAAEVALTIEKWGMLSQGESVLVGVSGGADSVCLVRILCELGHRPGLAHVNHGWRGLESDGDARFVESLAASLRLPFFERRAGEAPTGNPPLAPGSNEAEAREIRQRFFDAVMEAEDYQTLALAHSRDDRSETFLFHLLRGSGTQGLVSMRPVAGRTIRPLIATPRAEIETYLKQIGQPWRLDETNKDTRFSRNRIRHAVLPRLAEEFNPRLAESLARTIEILEAEDDWMERAAENWLKPRISEEGSALVVDLDDLPGQEVAFTRRVLRTALRWAGSSLTDMGFDHVENVRSLLEAGKSGKTIELPGDLAVERNFHTLVIRPAASRLVNYEYDLPIPGQVHVPEIDMVFRARLVPLETLKPKQGRTFVDGGSLGPCVKIRNWKNGDVYHPEGGRASKLKELFQKERIPRRRRRQWPVLVARSSIVWVASFPVSADFVPTGSSRTIVEFEAAPPARVT